MLIKVYVDRFVAERDVGLYPITELLDFDGVSLFFEEWFDPVTNDIYVRPGRKTEYQIFSFPAFGVERSDGKNCQKG
jgi:hypothetical protein